MGIFNFKLPDELEPTRMLGDWIKGDFFYGCLDSLGKILSSLGDSI